MKEFQLSKEQEDLLMEILDDVVTTHAEMDADDWGDTEEEQAGGIEYARQVEELREYLFPGHLSEQEIVWHTWAEAIKNKEEVKEMEYDGKLTQGDRDELARARLIKALQQLKSAAAEIQYQWDTDIKDEDDILCEKYPFGPSFDEVAIGIGTWVDNAVEKLESLG